MSDRTDLERALVHDGRKYASFQQLSGTRQLRVGVQLGDGHVQADPYTLPSRMRLILTPDIVAIPAGLLHHQVECPAVADFIVRCFLESTQRFVPEPTGTGNSDLVSIGDLGQEALPRIEDASLRYANLDHDALGQHVTLLRDQEHLWSLLAEHRLLASVGHGSVLPRCAGGGG